jgi:hypothetical protein
MASRQGEPAGLSTGGVGVGDGVVHDIVEEGADGACRNSGLAAGSVTHGVAGTIGSKTNVNY